MSEAPPVLSAEGERLLARRLSGAASARAAPIASTDDPAPLSFDQRRLWFLDLANPGMLAYNVHAAYRLCGDLDVPALSSALRHVVSRHEVLRSRFVVRAGEPCQLVGDVPVDLPCAADLSAEPDAIAAAAEHARSRASRPFALARGPLFRAWLARVGRDDHVLGILVHHTAFDGESLAIWAKEVAASYASMRDGQADRLAPLPVQYADYARWQRREEASEDQRRQLGYWRAAFRGAPLMSELPTDRDRPDRPSYRAGEVPVRLAVEQTEKLRVLAQQHRTTMFAVTLAGLACLLLRYGPTATGTVVGCPVNGRTRVDFEPLIGFFTKSLPIIAARAPGEDPTFAIMVERARDTLLAAHAHQDVPFDEIVRLVAPPRDLGHNPLFQVWFDFAADRPADKPGLELAGLRVTEFDIGLARTRFDLELHLAPAGSGLAGRLLFAEDLFDRATAQAFARHYEHFLAAVADEPGIRLSAVPLLAARERDIIVNEWGVAR